jgi:hypothetical protein
MSHKTYTQLDAGCGRLAASRCPGSVGGALSVEFLSACSQTFTLLRARSRKSSSGCFASTTASSVPISARSNDDSMLLRSPNISRKSFADALPDFPSVLSVPICSLGSAGVDLLRERAAVVGDGDLDLGDTTSESPELTLLPRGDMERPFRRRLACQAHKCV